MAKMKTTDNLEIAFAGESKANRRYLAFAKRADEEGLRQVAKLFRAVAAAETVHAMNHLKATGTVKDTGQNIRAAIEGETYEFRKMYPAMIKAAKKDGEQAAETSFRRANEVEKIHAGLYQKALASVEAGKDLAKKEMYVCQVCGNTVEGHPPEKCPVCGFGKDMFKKIE